MPFGTCCSEDLLPQLDPQTSVARALAPLDACGCQVAALRAEQIRRRRVFSTVAIGAEPNHSAAVEDEAAAAGRALAARPGDDDRDRLGEVAVHLLEPFAVLVSADGGAVGLCKMIGDCVGLARTERR